MGGGIMSREFSVIEVDHYNGVQMQIYDGIWGILSMQKGGGASKQVWYKRWVFKSKESRGISVPTDKVLVMAVRIGRDQSTAIKILETLLKQVKGE